ncbi:hypothetical protein XELAEV_18016006mg [Xenopus laevis]|uniref:Uncharacterized protein n=1 Tax=Xenopus laevis TaxID=8355 RepID=A0A974DJ47_XENLA|nr:hypothetical protein XELAEV_18016006mg [Xenopus laevis]
MAGFEVALHLTHHSTMIHLSRPLNIQDQPNYHIHVSGYPIQLSCLWADWFDDKKIDSIFILQISFLHNVHCEWKKNR